MSRVTLPEQRSIVFHDPAYPLPCSLATIIALVPQPFHLVNASELAAALDDGATTLISFHGAFFPKEAWTAIMRLCQRGGNLALWGGAPFTRPVRNDGIIEPESFAYVTQLGLGPFIAIEGNPDGYTLEASPYAAFLAEDTFHRSSGDLGQFWATNPQLTQLSDNPAELGSAGPINTLLIPLIFAMQRADDGQSQRIATPAYCLEHHSGAFAGGRWLISAWQPPSETLWCDNATAISQMITLVREGSQQLDTRTTFACYQPSEQPMVEIAFATQVPLRCQVSLTPPWQTTPLISQEYQLPAANGVERFPLPLCETPGIYHITTTYHAEGGPALRHEQGFWVWDEALVAQTSDKQLTAGRDFLYQGDQIFPLYGTTYMDSVVQRKFLTLPNPARWETDFAEMRQAGINLIRTGIWTNWEAIMPTAGSNEVALRSLDALVMTACAHNVQLVFTFFSFTPPMLAGVNPWLDPEALHHQEAYVAQLASRYRDVALVSWDLINEPSFGDPKRIFQQRAMPHRDEVEVHAFRAWLQAHYTLDELQIRWRMTPIDLPEWEAVMPPDDADYSTAIDDNTVTRYRLRARDFTHFSQDMVTQWGGRLRQVIREAGNHGLVSIGQDEAGVRPAPQFYGEILDYTTTHPWWNNDDLLWDMVLDKLPDKPNIPQEVGVMLTRDIAGAAFRSDTQAAYLLERKLLLSIAARSAGAIQWLWHTNAYMTNHNENNIGLVRADGSAKPELHVMLEFGRLIHTIAPFLRESEPPSVWLVIPYAQWFGHPQLGIAATRRAIRTLGYECGVIPQAINEYRFGHYLDGGPRPQAVIIPGVQYLSAQLWPHLHRYVAKGGRVLVSGVISRDEHDLTHFPEWLLSQQTTLIPQPVSHDEILRWGDRDFHFTYSGDKIGYVRKMHNQIETYHIGQGTITWSGLPLELADASVSLANLYYETLGIGSPSSTSVGLLDHHIPLAHGATMRVLASESSAPHRVYVAPGIDIIVAPNRTGVVVLTADGKIMTFGGCAIAPSEQ